MGLGDMDMKSGVVKEQVCGEPCDRPKETIAEELIRVVDNLCNTVYRNQDVINNLVGAEPETECVGEDCGNKSCEPELSESSKIQKCIHTVSNIDIQLGRNSDRLYEGFRL